jgi:AraC family transcriptional regulator
MLEEETDELLLSLPKSLLDNTVLDTGNRVELTNRHQIRDSELETLCWSIQREMEAGTPRAVFISMGSGWRLRPGW